MKRTLFTVLGTLIMTCFAVSAWAAAPIKVSCDKEGSINKTLARLAQSGNTRGVTILVSGTCKENITITGFDHLVLQGAPTATIQDASNGNDLVVNIYGSYDVTLQNFTINEGAGGVQCAGDSFCTLNLNAVQQSAGDGVTIRRSTAILTNNSILNHSGRGLAVVNSGKVGTVSNTISGNGGPGVTVLSGGELNAISDIVQNNAFGIRALNNSVVRASGVTISGNRSDGVRLESSSTARFEGDNGITGNSGNGVSINDLSFAGFSGDNVSGNLAQPDVACYPQFSATRGAGTVGGTTNCPN
jgi:hypothetical protein